MKRYGMDPLNPYGLTEFNNGGYVLYTDVQSLRAERDRLRGALVQAKQEFEYLSDQRFRFSREDRSRWDALADNTRRALEGNTTTTPERREG